MSTILLLYRVFLFSYSIGCYSALASDSEQPEARGIQLFELSPYKTRLTAKEDSNAYVARVAEPLMAILIEQDQFEPPLGNHIDRQEESDSISETSDYPYHDISTGRTLHEKSEAHEKESFEKLPRADKKSGLPYKSSAKKAKKFRPSKPKYQVKSGKASKVKKTKKIRKKSTYICFICKAQFTYSRNLVRHQREQHSSFVFTCCYCQKEFTRRESYDGHLNTHSENMNRKLYECSFCEKEFFGQRQLRTHKARSH